MKRIVVFIALMAFIAAGVASAEEKKAPPKSTKTRVQASAKKASQAKNKDQAQKKQALVAAKKAARTPRAAKPQAKDAEAQKRTLAAKRAAEAKKNTEAHRAAQAISRIDAAKKEMDQRTASDKNQLARMTQLLKRIGNIARQEKAQKTLQAIESAIKQETEAVAKRATARAEALKKLHQRPQPQRTPARKPAGRK